MGYDLMQLGIPKQKVNQFIKKGVNSIEDLLFYFPRKYYDFREPVLIRNLVEGTVQEVAGKVIWIRSNSFATNVRIRDAEGFEITIAFFGNAWQIRNMQVGETWYIGGKVTISTYDFNPTISNPIYVSKTTGGIMPVYSKITGMSDDYLKQSIRQALSFYQAHTVPAQKDVQAASIRLMPLQMALTQMHQPQSVELFRQAKTRITYEQIYSFYKDLYKNNRFAGLIQPPEIKSESMLDQFIADLPFPLTNGQASAILEIRKAAKNRERMNAIISGDVGCGKTLVAIAAALLMHENHLQTTVMAPTLVLATQHFEEFSQRLSPLGVRVALLTSNTKKKERSELLKRVKSGEIDVLIGTHSVLSPDIQFKNLGMTIIDEEHKFGTRQKELMEELDKLGAHHISMTATPIPRSYALTVYGTAVNIITIPDMPKGRKTVETQHIQKMEEALEKIYQEVQKGHQGYMVVPFVEDSESLKTVASVASTVAAAEDYYAKHHPGMRVGSISGAMKQADILKTVEAFSAGQFDLLISTTIVEVGVNVPNATMIAILNADRFGLAALHQLRGRVGRKGDQGYCLLVSEKDTQRLDILCTCHNGFEIAEQDMKLRGPGDLIGEKQSGDGSAAAIQAILSHPKLAASIRNFLVM